MSTLWLYTRWLSQHQPASRDTAANEPRGLTKQQYGTVGVTGTASGIWRGQQHWSVPHSQPGFVAQGVRPVGADAQGAAAGVGVAVIADVAQVASGGAKRVTMSRAWVRSYEARTTEVEGMGQSCVSSPPPR